MRKDTKARDFDRKTKIAIANRDSIDGWPCCVYCGRPAPDILAYSNAHFISRAQMGRGVEQNGLTLCPICHMRYDQTTERPKMRQFFREYLMEHYDDWDEENLIYRKDAEYGKRISV